MNTHEITEAMHEFDRNDQRSKDRFFRLVDKELTEMAANILHKFSKIHTLSPEDVVAELYPKLLRRPDLTFLSNRNQFYRYTYKIMLNLIYDYARRKHYKVQFDAYDEELNSFGFEDTFGNEDMELLLKCIDELMNSEDKKLTRIAAVASRRIFEGCPRKQLADEFNVDERTITRDWKAFVMYWKDFSAPI